MSSKAWLIASIIFLTHRHVLVLMLLLVVVQQHDLDVTAIRRPRTGLLPSLSRRNCGSDFQKHPKFVLPYPNDKYIDNEYIVVLNENFVSTLTAAASVKLIAQDLLAPGLLANSSKCTTVVTSLFEEVMKGFTIEVVCNNQQQLLESILNDERVLYVSRNVMRVEQEVRQVHIQNDHLNHQFTENANERRSLIDQTNASTGLDRIDQESLPLDGIYKYTNLGSNVIVYLFGGGMLFTHNEYFGRATCGYNYYRLENCFDSYIDGLDTTLASIIGGVTYGVAKNVSIVSVRILSKNGNSSLFGRIAGVEYVLKQKKENPTVPMVFQYAVNKRNRSPFSAAQITDNYLVSKLIKAGIVVIASTLGFNTDACDWSPANVATAITVGAVSPTYDTKSGYSNYGKCVDLYAPGINITSASYRGDNSTRTITSTHIAGSFVAGVVALYLDENPGLTPNEIYKKLIADASRNKIKDLDDDSPNLLLNKRDL